MQKDLPAAAKQGGLFVFRFYSVVFFQSPPYLQAGI